MATKYKVATGLLIAGIVCFVLFYLIGGDVDENGYVCLLYTSPSPRD